MRLAAALVGDVDELRRGGRIKSSAAMCCVLPTPTEAKRYSPGFAFRSARSSSMLRAGTPVFTTTTLGTTTTRPTGWMSFCARSPSLMRCGAMACPYWWPP